MTVTSARAPSRSRLVAALVRRAPVTLGFVLVLLVVGLVSGGLWRPVGETPLIDLFGYGVPAFEAGRWWTPVTGAFLVVTPWGYVPTLATMVSVGLLEAKRGSRVALGYFWIGHLFAVAVTALIVSVCAGAADWAWAQEQVQTLDVGPSAGALACLAAFLGTLRTSWRLRGWLILLATLTIGVLVLGALADLEHMAAVLLVLGVDRSLTPRRASLREQRLVAQVGMVSFAAIEVILAFVPTGGPLGTTAPLGGSPWSTAIDVAIVSLVVSGLRRARRWAWRIATALVGLNTLLAAALWVLLIADSASDASDLIDGDARIEIAAGILSFLLLVYLLSVRRAFQGDRHSRVGRSPEPDVREVRHALTTYGGGTLSWMSLWEGNSYARTSGGIVVYQRRVGVAIALADPLGPVASRSASAREFIAAAEHAGLVPCFFSAGADTRRAVPREWRSLVVADDTIVDLPDLAFRGKRWNSVRTSLNRAEREQVTFRMTRYAEEPWAIHAQLHAISEQWVGDKALPEMGFTLGTLTEAADPDVRIALALSAEGNVEGFLSWLPVYGEGRVRGWTLDVMRRREGGFGPVMEFLIAQSALTFRDEGAALMSLSGAPLTHEYPPEARLLTELSTRLADALEPVYGFRSLHRFKAKFHPRYETMYLLFRDEADLTRIAAGLTRAFLPSATLGQFARAGAELLRRDE